jgi:hypothetical protein
VLPRTNAAALPQVERFALGLLGVVYGVRAMFGAVATLDDLVTGAAWAETSSSLATAGIGAAVAGFAVSRLAQRSGWMTTAPPPPLQQQAAPSPFAPPQPAGAPQAPHGYYGPPPGGNPYQPR